MELLSVKDNNAIVQLNKEDIRAVMNAINEALELEDWEFEIRMGFTVNAIKELLSSFNHVYETLSPDEDTHS